MQVHGHDLLGHRSFELSGSHASLLENDVETISLFICTRSWLELVFDDFPGVFLLVPVGDRLEDTRGGGNVGGGRFRVIIANTRVRLLKVYINRNWLDKIERILLIERKTELAFRVQLWHRNILLYRYGVILSGSNLNCWVILEHLCC